MAVIVEVPAPTTVTWPVVAFTVATAALLDAKEMAPRDSEDGLVMVGPSSPKVLERSAVAESTGVPLRTVSTKFFDAAR